MVVEVDDCHAEEEDGDAELVDDFDYVGQSFFEGQFQEDEEGHQH